MQFVQLLRHSDDTEEAIDESIQFRATYMPYKYLVSSDNRRIKASVYVKGTQTPLAPQMLVPSQSLNVWQGSPTQHH